MMTFITAVDAAGKEYHVAVANDSRSNAVGGSLTIPVAPAFDSAAFILDDDDEDDEEDARLADGSGSHMIIAHDERKQPVTPVASVDEEEEEEERRWSASLEALGICNTGDLAAAREVVQSSLDALTSSRGPTPRVGGPTPGNLAGTNKAVSTTAAAESSRRHKPDVNADRRQQPSAAELGDQDEASSYAEALIRCNAAAVPPLDGLSRHLSNHATRRGGEERQQHHPQESIDEDIPVDTPTSEGTTRSDTASSDNATPGTFITDVRRQHGRRGAGGNVQRRAFVPVHHYATANAVAATSGGSSWGMSGLGDAAVAAEVPARVSTLPGYMQPISQRQRLVRFAPPVTGESAGGSLRHVVAARRGPARAEGGGGSDATGSSGADSATGSASGGNSRNATTKLRSGKGRSQDDDDFGGNEDVPMEIAIPVQPSHLAIHSRRVLTEAEEARVQHILDHEDWDVPADEEEDNGDRCGASGGACEPTNTNSSRRQHGRGGYDMSLADEARVADVDEKLAAMQRVWKRSDVAERPTKKAATTTTHDGQNRHVDTRPPLYLTPRDVNVLEVLSGYIAGSDGAAYGRREPTAADLDDLKAVLFNGANDVTAPTQSESDPTRHSTIDRSLTLATTTSTQKGEEDPARADRRRKELGNTYLKELTERRKGRKVLNAINERLAAIYTGDESMGERWRDEASGGTSTHERRPRRSSDPATAKDEEAFGEEEEEGGVVSTTTTTTTRMAPPLLPSELERLLEHCRAEQEAAQDGMIVDPSPNPDGHHPRGLSGRPSGVEVAREIRLEEENTRVMETLAQFMVPFVEPAWMTGNEEATTTTTVAAGTKADKRKAEEAGGDQTATTRTIIDLPPEVSLADILLGNNSHCRGHALTTTTSTTEKTDSKRGGVSRGPTVGVQSAFLRARLTAMADDSHRRFARRRDMRNRSSVESTRSVGPAQHKGQLGGSEGAVRKSHPREDADEDEDDDVVDAVLLPPEYHDESGGSEST